jgi:hypothetical protein
VFKADVDERWVIVHQNENEPSVRRYPVPGGWLYQVGTDRWSTLHREPEQFHPPVFVPFSNQPPPRKI